MQTSTKSLLIGLTLSSATALAMPVQALETHSNQGTESLLKTQRIEKLAQVKEVKKGVEGTKKAVNAVVDANKKAANEAKKAANKAANETKKAAKKVEKGLKKLKFW